MSRLQPPVSRPSILERGRWRWRRLQRAVLARRRLLAALVAAAAVLAGIRAASAPAEPHQGVVVAAADLAGGAVLGEADLEVRDLPREAVPAGTVEDPGALLGRSLAAPLREGEPVSDVRLVAPRLLAGYPGRVAVPVRIADAAVVGLLRVGDPIDLVATDPERRGAVTIARRAPVVALPLSAGTAAAAAGPMVGGLVVVAVAPETALTLSEASVSSTISVVLSQ